jgi:hypothetical protein
LISKFKLSGEPTLLYAKQRELKHDVPFYGNVLFDLKATLVGVLTIGFQHF